MPDGNVSRWTISYFAAAIIWLVGAEGLLGAGFGFPAADVRSPDTLVVVHMIGIGWLSMIMCGALFQFVPVLVAKPLYAERWVLPAFLLVNGGLAALLAGFLGLGGRLPVDPLPLVAGATLLMAGFALVAANLGLTLWHARPLRGAARFVSVGLLCLCVTAALGGIFAFVLAGAADGSLFMLTQAFAVPVHAIAGLGGWLTLTAMGVSYRLLAMFMVSPETDDGNSRAALIAGTAAVALAIVGSVVALMISAELDIVLSLAALSALATLAFYGRDVIALFRDRKRRALELNMRVARWSLVSLAAAAVLGATLAVAGSFERHVGALVFLVAFGWLSGLMLAKLFKIVAFLTWLETYGPVMGREYTPRVQDLVVEPRASKWFALFFLSVWGATAVLFAEQLLAFRALMLAATIATLGIARELRRVRLRLDVAAAVPAGAFAPQLLSPKPRLKGN